MKINRLILIPVLFLLAISSCKIGDEQSVTRNFYSFSVVIELAPIKQEYQNGDLFTMSFNKSGKDFMDESTGELIRVGNGKFTFQLDIFDPFIPLDDSDKFSLANQIGEITEVGQFEETGSAFISFGCPSSTYSLQTGVQFIKPGGYLVYLNQDDPFPQVVFTEDDDCSLIPINQIPPDNADIGTISYTFNVDDTNKEVFDTYAADFPNSSVDLTSIRTALDEKKAFFILVK